MATYVIGDVQGCAGTLAALIERLAPVPGVDAVWLAGDVVNRGQGSLRALRWAREHAAAVVLGNHDLHLLAVAAGLRQPKRRDTLREVLEAPDAEELVEWLRRRPLWHEEGEWVLVHAGLAPGWSRAEGRRLARAAEEALAGPEWVEFLGRVFDRRARREDEVAEAARLLTTLRCVDEQGAALDDYKGPPRERPTGSWPWFQAPGRAWEGQCRVLFGHWAALGLHVEGDAIGLDSGCVWGRRLSAYRLEDGAVFSVAAEEDDLL